MTKRFDRAALGVVAAGLLVVAACSTSEQSEPASTARPGTTVPTSASTTSVTTPPATSTSAAPTTAPADADRVCWVSVGGPTVRTSSDGVTWTEAHVTTDGSGYGEVATDGHQWIAVGMSAPGRDHRGLVLRSTDGRDWTATELPGSGSANRIAWNGHQWLLIGDPENPVEGTGVWRSDDGVTWTRSTAVTHIGTSAAVAAHDSTWVIVGITESAVSTDDGVTWTTMEFDESSPDLWNFSSVAWDGSQWIAVGEGETDGTTLENPVIATSADGLHWVPVLFAAEVGSLSDIVVSGSTRMAAGYDWKSADANFVWRSTDGKHWQRVTTGTSGVVRAFVTDGRRWIIGGDTLAVSDDAGATWAQAYDFPGDESTAWIASGCPASTVTPGSVPVTGSTSPAGTTTTVLDEITPTTVSPVQEALEAMLLTEDDLPNGYVIDEEADEPDDGSTTTTTTTTPATTVPDGSCDLAPSSILSDPERFPHAAVSFIWNEFPDTIEQPIVTETLVAAPSAAAAGAEVDEVAALAARCPRSVVTQDGATLEITIVTRDGPVLGDRSVVLRMVEIATWEGDTDSGPQRESTYVELVVVAKGSIVAMIASARFGMSFFGRQPDDPFGTELTEDEFEQLCAVAVDRITPF